MVLHEQHHHKDGTVEYPLMATTLSRPQLDKIMVPVLHGGLPQSSVQCNMPRAIVYGSLNVQGLDVNHPYSSQTIQHLQTIMRHATRPTITGGSL